MGVGVQSDADAGVAQALTDNLGVNTGESVQEKGDYFGTAVTLAARIADRAQGGQILVSEVVRTVGGSLAGAEFREAGRKQLKGIGRQRVYEVVSRSHGHDGPLASTHRRVGRSLKAATTTTRPTYSRSCRIVRANEGYKGFEALLTACASNGRNALDSPRKAGRQ